MQMVLRGRRGRLCDYGDWINFNLSELLLKSDVYV